ncbi:MAG: hypothetical protein KatS3mg053_1704 [Candidatus Roseilinea sp.]|nr:MAG: hypothetical protein KatS3mg053_1704 [Candidatus Roseilinea sp.]
MKLQPSLASVTGGLALVISLVNTFMPLGRVQASPPRSPQAEAAAAVGTVFTYQGRLNDGTTPANGAYDFEFALFDDAAAGVQIGATVALNNVAVSNGIFTVQLDFGNPFWQQQTYLEVRVRKSGDPSFTTLAPRSR